MAKSNRRWKKPTEVGEAATVESHLREIRRALPSAGTLEEIKALTIKTDSKAQAAVIRLHNLQVEVEQLREELRRTNQLILSLLDDPEARAHAQASARYGGGVNGGDNGMTRRG